MNLYLVRFFLSHGFAQEPGRDAGRGKRSRLRPGPGNGFINWITGNESGQGQG